MEQNIEDKIRNFDTHIRKDTFVHHQDQKGQSFFSDEYVHHQHWKCFIYKGTSLDLKETKQSNASSRRGEPCQIHRGHQFPMLNNRASVIICYRILIISLCFKKMQLVKMKIMERHIFCKIPKSCCFPYKKGKKSQF